MIVVKCTDDQEVVVDHIKHNQGVSGHHVYFVQQIHKTFLFIIDQSKSNDNNQNKYFIPYCTSLICNRTLLPIKIQLYATKFRNPDCKILCNLLFPEFNLCHPS